MTSASAAVAQTGERVPPTATFRAWGHRSRSAQSPRDRQNPDLLAPPSTDHGTLAKPPLLFRRCACAAGIRAAGPARSPLRELGISKTIAGVNMRLNAGGVRELHWHKAAEWAYMLYGTCPHHGDRSRRDKILSMTSASEISGIFPSGIPHSIQGLGPDGCEFLLVFDDGEFDEDNTFLLSDWFKHVPNEVLGKNFGVPAHRFSTSPDPSELYIFAAPVPGAAWFRQDRRGHPVPQTFSHRMLAQAPIKTNSGTVRITDSSVFPASKTIAAALVEVRARRHARNALASQHR